MKIEGRFLLFDTVSLNRDVFPKTCFIDIPERVPLLLDFSRSKTIGIAKVSRDDYGLFCKAEILHSEKINDDVIKSIFDNGRFGAGGYYTNARSRKNNDLIIVNEATLNAVSLVTAPVRDEYYFEIQDMASKIAKELDTIVSKCPCRTCSDEFRMSCRGCDGYYEWINKLKGE